MRHLYQLSDPPEFTETHDRDAEHLDSGVGPSIRQTSDHSYEFGDIAIDFRNAEVRKGGRPINLATKELQLLRYLIENRDRVVPRQEILRRVWEYANEVSSRTIDTHVAWLRQKLEDHPATPIHIQTVRGKGYRFAG
jgi:two-component system, OmpR family, alkaline phosphatase synthesis response regulator PhoP